MRLNRGYVMAQRPFAVCQKLSIACLDNQNSDTYDEKISNTMIEHVPLKLSKHKDATQPKEIVPTMEPQQDPKGSND